MLLLHLLLGRENLVLETEQKMMHNFPYIKKSVKREHFLLSTKNWTPEVDNSI